MAIAIWKPGRRLFSTAAVLMILTATAHTAGFLSRGPGSPEEESVISAMRGLHFPSGMGMSPSLNDVYWDLVFTMSVTFAALGLINLVVAASAEIPDRVLLRVSWVNALWIGAFLAMSWAYRIPPPLISAVLIEAVVVASIVVPGRRAS
jgi:hypothetical protein